MFVCVPDFLLQSQLELNPKEARQIAAGPAVVVAVDAAPLLLS